MDLRSVSTQHLVYELELLNYKSMLNMVGNILNISNVFKFGTRIEAFVSAF